MAKEVPIKFIWDKNTSRHFNISGIDSSYNLVLPRRLWVRIPSSIGCSSMAERRAKYYPPQNYYFLERSMGHK